MKVDIIFDANYPYTSDFFGVSLERALKDSNYMIKILRFASHGEVGRILVNGKEVERSHNIHKIIKRVEQEVDRISLANSNNTAPAPF